jgi:hypothetical protein
MANEEKIIQWIEEGKQLGKVFSFKINENTIWKTLQNRNAKKMDSLFDTI